MAFGSGIGSAGTGARTGCGTLRQSGKIIAQALILGNNREFSVFATRLNREAAPGEKMEGIHLLGEWYGCAADTAEMTRSASLRALCVRLAEASAMTIVGDSFHHFEPQGVTGTVLLAESHLAIHTWPEHGFVTIDVYVCNYQSDNTAKAEALFGALQDVLKPERTRFHTIRRGGKDA